MQDVERVARAMATIDARDGADWELYEHMAQAAMRETRLIDAETLWEMGKPHPINSEYGRFVIDTYKWLLTRAQVQHDAG